MFSIWKQLVLTLLPWFPIQSASDHMTRWSMWAGFGMMCLPRSAVLPGTEWLSSRCWAHYWSTRVLEGTRSSSDLRILQRMKPAANWRVACDPFSVPFDCDHLRFVAMVLRSASCVSSWCTLQWRPSSGFCIYGLCWWIPFSSGSWLCPNSKRNRIDSFFVFPNMSFWTAEHRLDPFSISRLESSRKTPQHVRGKRSRRRFLVFTKTPFFACDTSL